MTTAPLDKPLSPEDFPDPSTVQAARSRTEVIINLVRRDKLTLRQLLGYLAGARGHYVTAGTPAAKMALARSAIPGRRLEGAPAIVAENNKLRRFPAAWTGDESREDDRHADGETR